MRSSLLAAAVYLSVLSGCGGQSSIKPAEILDERTGVTVGALQEPLEFVQGAQNAALGSAKRVSFAYMGPIEWDRMGDISYGLWVHVAPGNDRRVGSIRSPGAVTLTLDDGPLVLTAIEAPAGGGPYKPVVSWGQTDYFALTVAMLKRMAASQTIAMEFRAADDSTIEFLPSHDTHTTLSQFTRFRGITDD